MKLPGRPNVGSRPVFPSVLFLRRSGMPGASANDKYVEANASLWTEFGQRKLSRLLDHELVIRADSPLTNPNSSWVKEH